MTFNKEALTRQLDLIPIEKLGERITIIGAGAVGSWLTLALAKMGFGNLSVIDSDDVSIENMNCSLYPVVSVSTPKAVALGRIIRDFTGFQIETYHRRFEPSDGARPGIVIAAVDSMEARKMIWGVHKENPSRTRAFIDPRMGAETALLYVMDPKNQKDIESYEKTLYTDENAVREPCTRKATAYCALPLAGIIAAQVKALVTGNNYSRITQWDIPQGALQSWAGGATK